MDLQLKILRFDPSKDREPYYQIYRVTASAEERLLDCLNRVKWEQDGTLGFRMSCAHGVCGSDAMRIDGRCGLACQKLVRDLGGDEVVLEPLPTFSILKDLIVDMEPFLRRVELIRPYLITADPQPERERRQSPEERARFNEAIRCILCACCTAACPVAAEREGFLGPAALVWAFRYIFDSRDEATRHRINYRDGTNCPGLSYYCRFG